MSPLPGRAPSTELVFGVSSGGLVKSVVCLPNQDWDTAWGESIQEQAHIQRDATGATRQAVEAVCLNLSNLDPTAQFISASVEVETRS